MVPQPLTIIVVATMIHSLAYGMMAFSLDSSGVFEAVSR